MDSAQRHLWRLTAALRFSTADHRYRWLNNVPGLWEGLFDERAGRAWYRTYTIAPESSRR